MKIYQKDLENLSETIDELAKDKGDLIGKVQELMENLTSLKAKYGKTNDILAETINETENLKADLDARTFEVFIENFSTLIKLHLFK